MDSISEEKLDGDLNVDIDRESDFGPRVHHASAKHTFGWDHFSGAPARAAAPGPVIGTPSPIEPVLNLGDPEPLEPVLDLGMVPLDTMTVQMETDPEAIDYTTENYFNMQDWDDSEWHRTQPFGSEGDDFGIGVIIPSTYGHPSGYQDEGY